MLLFFVDISSKEGIVDKQLEKLEKGIQFFEDNLGLKLQRFPGNVSMLFSDHAKCCFILLKQST